MRRPRAVVKVGGSLFDLPDLGSRLRQWLAGEWPDGDDVLLIPGGGPTADAVRELDHRHGLGEEASHWLALRALSLNAHFLASLLPSARVIDNWQDGDTDTISILNMHKFARADENRPGCLPHRWTVTSDALAARVAVVTGAAELILLKSTPIPPELDWREAGRAGLVDEWFAEVLNRTSTNLSVRAVNLRAWDASRCG